MTRCGRRQRRQGRQGEAGPGPLSARAVRRLYPRRWRERYGEEFASVLADMTAATPWPARAALIADALSGALDARLHHRGGSTMPDRIRGSVAVAACAVIPFVIAGAGFAKMTEYADFREAADRHLAIAVSFDVLRGAAVVAGVAVLAGALPVAWSVVRQAVAGRRADLIRPPAAAAAAIAGYAAVVPVVVRLSGRHPGVHSAAYITAVTTAALLGIAVAAVCGWAAVAVLRRADLAPRLLRSEVILMIVLTLCMVVVTGADISWGLATRAADSALFHGDNGLVATPLPPSWAGTVLVLAAVTAVTAAATVRAARELRAPAS